MVIVRTGFDLFDVFSISHVVVVIHNTSAMYDEEMRCARYFGVQKKRQIATDGTFFNKVYISTYPCNIRMVKSFHG